MIAATVEKYGKLDILFVSGANSRPTLFGVNACPLFLQPNARSRTHTRLARCHCRQNNAGYEGPTMCPEPTGFPSVEDDTMLAINAINMTGPL